jgi:hypothetical protein
MAHAAALAASGQPLADPLCIGPKVSFSYRPFTHRIPLIVWVASA